MIAGIVCGRQVSRQTLWLNGEIRAARTAHGRAREDWLVKAGAPASSTPLQMARVKLDELKGKLAERDETIARYHELFARHLINARLHGVSQEMLQRALPKIRRGARSELPSRGR